MSPSLFAGSSYTVNLYAALPIATAGAIFLLGGAVVVGERRSIVSLLFASVTATAGVWLLAISGGFLAMDEPVALFWDKAVYLAVPLIPATVYQFSVFVLGIQRKRRRQTWLMWLTSVGFAAIIVTTALFDGLYHYVWGFYPRYSWLGIPFLIWFVGALVASLVELRLAMRRSTPGSIYHRRALAFILAFAAGYLGAVDFLPAFGVPVYPFGSIFLLVFLVLSARAIRKYRLVDVTPALAAPRIIDTMTDALIVIDREGVIRVVNRATSELVGRGEGSLVGRSFQSGPCQAIVADAYSALLGGDSIDVQRTYRSTQTLDDSRTLSLSASILCDRKGAPAAVVCVARDVTERVRHEERISRQAAELRATYDELQQTHQQVIQQERLHALGQMASGVAHDFNNMLSVIVSYAELPLLYPEDLQDTARMRETLELISAAAKDAANTVGRLRDFYRYREPSEEFIPVNLASLVEDVIAFTRPRWKSQAQALGISIDVVADLESVSPVLGNESEIRELLANLVLNAIDAMPRGGTIVIRTRQCAAYAQLEVRDTGTGMTEDVRQRCLEPFFSTKGTKGTGLGLSMVFGIVQRHGGEIGIESEIDVGTTFVVQFPISRGDATGVDLKTAAVSAIQPLRVLVVDDEAPIRSVITAYLTADGHMVVTAADGEAALQIFQAAQFDVVLTDLGMPGMTGHDLAARIKATAPSTFVILVSGFGHLATSPEYPASAVDLVLQKPVTSLMLRRALELANPARTFDDDPATELTLSGVSR